MPFNFKGIFKFTKKIVFEEGPPFRITARTVLWVIYFYLLYPLWQLFIWFGLILDKIFYPQYAKVEIKEPIFIVGNPRSGTTFLHRLLAKDEETFNVIKTWEIFAAPSIVGRKLFRFGMAIDRFFDRPVLRRIKKFERDFQKDKVNKIHKTAFWETEEDDNLFIHTWDTLKVWVGTGFLKETRRYLYFDQLVSLEEKRRTFRFYKDCLKRHIFFHQAEDRHYLAKNPNFSPMIETLNKEFPDCKIIYIARNPLKMIPSYISLIDTIWGEFGDGETQYGCKEYVLEMAKHWYEYPLKKLEKLPKDRYAVVTLEDIVKDVEGSVEKLYSHFGLKVTPRFRKKLAKLARKAKKHKSVHKYSFEKMGLSKKQIVKRFSKVFKRFKFSTSV